MRCHASIVKDPALAGPREKTMMTTDFHARAELYLGSDWATAAAQGSRTFATAAQAIRFAFEEAAPVSLRGVKLIIGDTAYGRDDLTTLYQSADFPLPRKGDIRRSRDRRNRRQRSATRSRRLEAPARSMVNA
jgi:hypothetical protein